MRLLILGASGGCGRWVTRLAHADGHTVTALVRPDTAFAAPPGVTVHRGSVLNDSDLGHAVAGQDAVISCLGAQRVNAHNPWSPLRPPLHVARESAARLVPAMQAAGVRKLAAISAAGVGDSLAVTNATMRWLIRSSSIGRMYADLEAMEAVYRLSALDWLAVRPVTLVDAKTPSTRARVVPRFRMVSTISRADVATWLLRSAVDPQPIGDRTPMIGYR
ncbi:MAG: NAD(P)H-binding protein [Vicinamibacterales bacterium]